jgi:L-alanine-DL-glutamate epimerase-like enolase superfamily enzyme
MKLSQLQAKLQVWHPRARFETIAMDVLEISPTPATGMTKVVLIGDIILFSRFTMAIAVSAETAAAIADRLQFSVRLSVFCRTGEGVCVGGCAEPLREGGD